MLFSLFSLLPALTSHSSAWMRIMTSGCRVVSSAIINSNWFDSHKQVSFPLARVFFSPSLPHATWNFKRGRKLYNWIIMSCEIQRDWVRCPHSQCMQAGYVEAGWRRALSHYLFFSEPWALTVAFTSLVRTLGQLWCWDLTPNNVIESVLFINENLLVDLRNSIIYRQLPLNSPKSMALVH